MREPRVFKKAACAIRRSAGKDAVLRDIVCAHCEDREAVDRVAEGFAPCIRFSIKRHRAQTDAARPGIENLRAVSQFAENGIQRLIAIPGGPPELGGLNPKRLAFICGKCIAFW